MRFKLAIKAIGTIIERTSTVNGKKYKRVWLYIPQRLSDDSQFPFASGDPVELEADVSRKKLMVSLIGKEEAKAKGWTSRPKAGKR